MAREIWTNGDDKAQTEWYAKVAEFERNEDERKLSESNRVLNFKTWSLQFQDFISNDAKHKYNEEQRNAKFNIIKSDWDYIMDGLSEADIGNLAVEINKIRAKLSNHVKSLTINSIDNTIEAWLEKDIDVPSFILKLPKISYDDLADKPVSEKYSTKTYDVVRQGDIVLLTLKSGTVVPTINSTVLPVAFRPSIEKNVSATYWADSNTIWTIYCNIMPNGSIALFVHVRDKFGGEKIHETTGTIRKNPVLTYSI